jgi:hypothetical protein
MKAKLAYAIGNLVAAPFTWMLADKLVKYDGAISPYAEMAWMAGMHTSLCALITLFVLPSRRSPDPQESLRHRIQVAVEERSK